MRSETQNISHRNQSAKNIWQFFEECGRPKCVQNDFGSSRPYTSSHFSGIFVCVRQVANEKKAIPIWECCWQFMQSNKFSVGQTRPEISSTKLAKVLLLIITKSVCVCVSGWCLFAKKRHADFLCLICIDHSSFHCLFSLWSLAKYCLIFFFRFWCSFFSSQNLHCQFLSKLMNSLNFGIFPEFSPLKK